MYCIFHIKLEKQKSTETASYLYLYLEIDSEGLGLVEKKNLYDKRDTCNFNFPIVNFPYICTCSNIPIEPAYGICISQLIKYSRACGFYRNFLDRGLLLTSKLRNQGFLVVNLKLPLMDIFHLW